MAKNEPLLATKRCVDIPIPFENAISSLMSALTSGPDEEIPIEEHTLLKRVGPAVGTYLSLEEKRVLENQFLFNHRIVYRENAKDLLTNILQRPSEEFCIFKKVAWGRRRNIFWCYVLWNACINTGLVAGCERNLSMGNVPGRFNRRRCWLLLWGEYLFWFEFEYRVDSSGVNSFLTNFKQKWNVPNDPFNWTAGTFEFHRTSVGSRLIQC